MASRPEGQFSKADYFQNTGGLNVTDSPFAVRENMATGGQNFDYVRTGGIRKRLGHQKINTVADTQLNTLGIGILNTQMGVKTVIRAAGTKLQNVDISVPTFTNLTEDTVTAGSDFLASGSVVRVIKSQFNTSTSDVLWMAGGGMSSIFGVYSPTKVTANGVAAPTGTLPAPVVSAGTSTFSATGEYFYAIEYRKGSTQAVSNAALDVSATISNTTDKVTIALTGLTNLDTTKFDKIIIYRSAVSGVEGFTVGDLIATLNSTATSYDDDGSSVLDSINIPRADNTELDNSVLPSGTYKVLTTWKRRLITSQDSTIRLSDLNKPEAWPTVNTLTIPSGGNITGLAVISNSSTTTPTLDEILVIFKEREIWTLTGNDTGDWQIQFVDVIGCPSQSLVALGNGYIAWMDARGIYMWSGISKPIYISRPLESFFAKDGDIDMTKLERGYSAFYRKENQIIWSLSHKIFGENKFAIKLDLRLTLPQVSRDMVGSILEGVFTVDSGLELDAIEAMIPPSEKEESLLGGDAAGFMYRMYNAASDGGAAIDWKYETAHLDQQLPGTTKRYHKVIVWVDQLGDWNLTLDYWTNYHGNDPNASTRAVQISNNFDQSTAIWDVAYWDIAFWDDSEVKRVPLVFNLGSENGNAEGNSIKLRFRNNGVDQPVTISGYSILFAVIGFKDK